MAFRPRRRDPSLPHQLFIQVTASSMHLYVTCNCLYRGRNPLDYEPIARARDYYEAARLYNDPAAHRLEFGDKDKVRLG